MSHHFIPVPRIATSVMQNSILVAEMAPELVDVVTAGRTDRWRFCCLLSGSLAVMTTIQSFGLPSCDTYHHYYVNSIAIFITQDDNLVWDEALDDMIDKA